MLSVFYACGSSNHSTIGRYPLKMEIDEHVSKYAFILSDCLPMLYRAVQVFQDFLTEPAHDGTLTTIAVELSTRQFRFHEVFKLITATARTVLVSIDNDHGRLEGFVFEVNI